MKNIFTSLFLLIQFLSVAQDNQQKEGKVSLGLTFSPDNCYRILDPDNSNSSKMIAEWRNNHEVPKLGYTTGLSILINLKDKIDIESGILFSKKGERLHSMFLYLGENADPRLDNLYDTSLSSLYAVGFDYGYYYFDIPAKINYVFIDEELKIFVSIGISTNFFINHKITSYLYFEDDKVEKKTSTNSYYSFKSINFTILGSLGLNYDLNNRLKLKLEPTYRRSINTIIDAPIKSHLYSTGLVIGLYYKL